MPKRTTGYSKVVACYYCERVYQRDINACRNLLGFFCFLRYRGHVALPFIWPKPPPDSKKKKK